MISGFSQKAMSRARIVQVGAGALGSEITHALVRKGIGELTIFDDDVVTITNLTRQFYYKKDLYKPKAFCLAKNLSRIATNDSLITGIALRFEDALSSGRVPQCDIAIIGVDNPSSRFACSTYYKNTEKKPAVFTAVNREGEGGYVFVQEPNGPCFGCVMGDEYGKSERKCVGSTIDIHKSVGGIVSYAVDSLLMKRARKWNYKRISFSGFLSDVSMVLEKNIGCRFCGETDLD